MSVDERVGRELGIDKWFDALPNLDSPTPLCQDSEHSIYWLGITNESAFRCNTYLIKCGSEAILVDPGGKNFFQQVHDRVSQIMDPRDITGMILCHQDPDVAGSMTDWLGVNSAMKVLSTPRTHILLPYYGIENYTVYDVEKEPHYLLPNGKAIHFYPSPFLHFPGAFVTYDETTGFLFSGDIWAALDSEWKLILDDFDAHIPKMDLFHKDYMASNIAARHFIRSIDHLDIQAILPQHGSIIGKAHIQEAKDYLAFLECGIDLLCVDHKLDGTLLEDEIKEYEVAHVGISEIEQINTLLDTLSKRLVAEDEYIEKKETKLLTEVMRQSARLVAMRDKALRGLKIASQKLQRSEKELSISKQLADSLLELNRDASQLDEKELCDRALDLAVQSADSQVGYLHFLNDDQNTISLVSWNKEALKYCNAEHDTHYPMEKAGIWADCARLKETVIHNDYPNEPNKQGMPEGHFSIKRHMSTPVIDNGKIVMIMGVGNKKEPYNDSDAKRLEFIANEVEKFVMRKRTHDNLQKANDFTSLLLSSVGDGVYGVDTGGRCSFINEAALDMLGYTRDEVLGFDQHQLFHFRHKNGAEYPKSKCPIFQTSSDGLTREVQEAFIGRNGECIDVHLKVAPITRYGVVIGAVVVFQDITEKLKMEENLRSINKHLKNTIKEETNKRLENEKLLMQQSKMAAMGEMIGAIAHQWRQPLNSLGMTIQDVPVAYKFGEVNEDYLSKFKQEAMGIIHTMSSTIDDFRNFFSQNKKQEEFYIEDAVNDVLKILSAQLKINSIDVVLDTDEANKHRYRCFKNELKQVILNILANAKDALIEKKPEKPFIKIAIKSTENTLEICIEDSAGGIPEEIIDKVFDSHFTTKEEGKGTGIGLYMSKEIVENSLNGKLLVANAGHGARFTIALDEN